MRLFYLLKILPSDFTISRFQKFFEIFSPICNWQSFVLPACVSFAENTKTNFCAWVNHTRTETWNREGTPHREYLSLGQVRLGLYEEYNILQDGWCHLPNFFFKYLNPISKIKIIILMSVHRESISETFQFSQVIFFIAFDLIRGH